MRCKFRESIGGTAIFIFFQTEVGCRVVRARSVEIKIVELELERGER